MCKGKIFNKVRFTLLGVPLLFLTACHSDFGPFSMPSGYTHHGKTYQAPPGPEPVLEKIENMHVAHSVEHNNVHHGDSERTAGNMVHIDRDGYAHTNVSAEPVMEKSDVVDIISQPVAAHSGHWSDAASSLLGNVVSKFGHPTEPVYVRPASSVAEMDFEKALRTAMVQKGITIAPVQGAGPYVADYVVSPLEADNGRVLLTLTLQSAGQVVSEHSGVYQVTDHAPAKIMPQAGSADLEPATGGPVAISPAQ